MKLQIKTSLLFGLLCVGLICCQPKTADTFDREKVKQEFKNMLIDYGVAIEKGNAEKTITFFSESPDFFLYSDGKKYTLEELKKEIREEWHHEDSPRILKINWNEIDITVLSETAVTCFVKVDEFETDKNETRGHPLRVAVDATFAGIKTGDQWKIVYGHAIHKVVMDSTKASVK